MRWDRAPALGPKNPVQASTRLEYLTAVCGLSASALQHLGSDVQSALLRHPNVNGSSRIQIPVKPIIRFRWSQWPPSLGGKPTLLPSKLNQGYGNVTIEADWEVTLDEDVDFIHVLNISGVLKFVDKPGCCKLVARYVLVGAFYGRLEAGTAQAPITHGKAHIVLKGQPMTPYMKTFRPHIVGSAKWMKSKYIAVQGTLSLFGQARKRTFSRIAQSVSAGARSIMLEGGNFQIGDTVTIDRGLETRKLTGVRSQGNAVTISFTEPLGNSYKGADHVHLGRRETQGLMAAYVGLTDGHTVVVEGEDTPGAPMCDLNETVKCKYSSGMPPGVSLHDFAKEMRHYYQTTGSAAHPNCRPCGAVSDMGFSGYIMAMAYFHADYDRCPKDHGVIEISGVAFHHGSSISLYHDYDAGNYPFGISNFIDTWSRYMYKWWRDPLWAELAVSTRDTPNHLIEKSSFNNSWTGTAFALATSGVYVFPTRPVHGNVVLTGGVGLNGAAREAGPTSMRSFNIDRSSPMNDNVQTVTEGVGSPGDSTNPRAFKKIKNPAKPAFQFRDNFLSGAPLVHMQPSEAVGNVLTGNVRMQGEEVNGVVPKFRNNTITSPGDDSCVFMWTSGTKGIADNVIFGCDVCLGFRQKGQAQGFVKNMRLLDCNYGLHYFTQGPDSKRHDATRIKFQVEDTTVYARENGKGVGMTNPKVHVDQLGHPGPPDWWTGGPKSESLGHSNIIIDFRAIFSRITFIGYRHQNGGVAMAWGEKAPGDSGDSDFSPIIISGLNFVDTDLDSRLRFGRTTGAGMGLRSCLQIDCDGRRNSLIIDTDGSLVGSPGTVIPFPQKFYDKLGYVDPMGFDTMEDLIPMAQRYDRFGDAIPFPKGVNHGYGGGLEYQCLVTSSRQDGVAGCDVVFMVNGSWLPMPGLALSPGARVVAIKEDGGLIRLDPLYHGWAYATGWVRTADCRLTQDYANTSKPESQHARRFGRVGPGQFGSHPNTSKVQATRGPVYTVPGIYRKNCSFVSTWNAYRCPGAQHRHLLIEVMDWNHMQRRWAPVTVEVNDNYSPQGGTLNVLTGPAMYWGGLRLQTFHALGHVGLRHNIFFSADPPQHLRIQLQNTPADQGVVICIYYGIPNTVVAYVNGKKKRPLLLVQRRLGIISF